MFSTPNMNLICWDQLGDDFSHLQLSADLVALDGHDHSAGRGVQINTPGIRIGAITTPLIADGVVTNAKLAANAVATANLQDHSVTHAKIAPGAITGDDIANNTIGYTQLDINVMPLGSVVLWWRPVSSASVPGGNWEIMDGRAWSGITNSLGLNTGNIPDMRGVFARGADVNGSVAPGVGVASGAPTIGLAHTHYVEPHLHGMPTHSHLIPWDGDHYHTWVGGLDTWSRTNAFGEGLTMKDIGNANQNNTFFTLYIKNILSSATFVAGDPILAEGPNADGPAHMDHTGGHSHSGSTSRNDVFTTYDGDSTTDSQLGSPAIIPPSVGLLYIMRVR